MGIIEFFCIVLFILESCAWSQAQAKRDTCPDSVIMRYEWDSPEFEPYKDKFITSIEKLMNRPDSNQTQDPTIMSYHDLVKTHVENVFWWHASANFFPAHRAMLYVYEKAIHSTGFPSNIGIPFADTAHIASPDKWQKSSIFKPEYFGTYGSAKLANGRFDRRDEFDCLTDGVAAYPKYRAYLGPTNRGFSSSKNSSYCKNIMALSDDNIKECSCVRRVWTNNALWSNVPIFDIINNNDDYDTFHGDDTSGTLSFHPATHAWWGGQSEKDGASLGDMSEPSFAANDPIFFLHHAFVDRVWSLWQSRCPPFKKIYDGKVKPNDPIWTNRVPKNASLDNPIDGFPQFRVHDLVDSQASLCYEYGKAPSDLPLKGCPDKFQSDASSPSTPIPSSPSSATSSSPSTSTTTSTTTSSTPSTSTTTSTTASSSASTTSTSSNSMLHFPESGISIPSETESAKVAIPSAKASSKKSRRDDNAIDPFNLPSYIQLVTTTPNNNNKQIMDNDSSSSSSSDATNDIINGDGGQPADDEGFIQFPNCHKITIPDNSTLIYLTRLMAVLTPGPQVIHNPCVKSIQTNNMRILTDSGRDPDLYVKPVGAQMLQSMAVHPVAYMNGIQKANEVLESCYLTAGCCSSNMRCYVDGLKSNDVGN